MRYFATASIEMVREAVRSNPRLGQIVSPAAGNRVVPGAAWIADNSVFAGKYPGDDRYLAWLRSRSNREKCMFAVAPDVVGDAAATLERSLPMLARIREIVPVAYVAQDGASIDSLPWEQFDALFIGGSTEWKLGSDAAALVRYAVSGGMWVHMGRVNSLKRLRYAKSIGCDSVDGTYLRWPSTNLPKLEAWMSVIDK